MVVELLTRFPTPEDRAWIFREAAWRLDLSFAFQAGERLAPQGPRPASLPLLPLEQDLTDALEQRDAPALRHRLGHRSAAHLHPRAAAGRRAARGLAHSASACSPARCICSSSGWSGSSILLFAIAALFLKNQVRAIRRLANAAEAFGRGRDIGPIKPEGASEVRQAAAAFNRMQANIRRFVQRRTEMLAGISHDLRTP